MNIPSLILEHARQSADHPAVVIADGPTLSYAQLAAQIERVGAELIALGVGPSDRIGIALHDGPEMLAAFLGVVSVATAAPLNPSCREPEFALGIDDLGLAAMIVGSGPREIPAATRAAAARGIPIIRITAQAHDGCLAMTVAGERLRATVPRQPVRPDDIALVLQTSGTTARPKIVPLRHRNLLASSQAIATGLVLSAEDRVCNVMPLFHIHGLVAGLCASLVAGATVICTPGFSAADMPRWLCAHRATWYTAVPTMHQAILDRARSHPAEFARLALRFIRSSSASLPPTVMAGLESTFGCPVVEAYGMTEAAHQMASNPLPPRARKPGSVGLPAGSVVAVMNENGTLLPIGAIGEVVVRGPNVMDGYHGDDTANRAAFTDGWFRTGDQGWLDDDGYLFLTGRLKEIIKRGGETVSPREIDEVLLTHPAVHQVVTFAVPDRRLGEQVAAAVVRVPGTEATERQLREHVGARLAPFKVPRRVVFVDTLPRGPSGKLRRIGLAEQLGLSELDAPAAPDPYVGPTSAAERLLAELWAEVLRQQPISINTHFLDAGGDSLAAARLLTRVHDEIGVELSMIAFFDAATIAEQAALIEAALLTEEDDR